MSTERTLDDRVRELGELIREKSVEQKQAWARFDKLRGELAHADISDEKAVDIADGAHREYNELVEEVEGLKGQQERLWGMTQERGKTENGTPGREQREFGKELVRRGERLPESFGQRIVGGELYAEANKQGVWNRNQQSKVGEVQLGEMMSRDEFWVLITGASDTSAGSLVSPDNRGIYVYGDRPLVLTDLITVGSTDSDVVEFVRQTSFTNNAAAVAEATDVTGASGLKPQSDLVFEKVAESVSTLAHWIAATRRALADAAQLRSMIDGRLRMGLVQVLETQLVAGDGVGENLLGLLNQPGIQSQPQGGDTQLDAIHRALTKVRLAYFEPTAVAINALDWENIRLAKDANENYYYGPPALAGASTVWGKAVAIGAQFPEGNPIVGDFRQAELWIREGVQVLASDSHADFFIRNLIALLAEMRVAFGVPLPQAFCEVTSA